MTAAERAERRAADYAEHRAADYAENTAADYAEHGAADYADFAEHRVADHADYAEHGAADHAEHADVGSGVGFVLRLLPAADRETIAGDLLEGAAYRGLEGARLRWWLLGECATIAAGLSITRVRGWLVLPPVREVVSGFAVDGRGVLRGAHQMGAVVRALIFCGSIATLALGVELLVAALMSAAGL